MSFPKDSAWGHQDAVERAYVPPAPGLNVPTRRMGQAGIIEIPERALEAWVHDLNIVVDQDSPQELFDTIAQMLSYLRGVERVDSHSIRFVGKDMVEVDDFLEFIDTYNPDLAP